MLCKERFRDYMLFFIGVGPAILINTGVQLVLFSKTQLYIVALLGTFSGFIFKYIWDKILVFNIRLSLYLFSSIIATIITLSLEHLFIYYFSIFFSALLSFFIGYNVKYCIDSKLKNPHSEK